MNKAAECCKKILYHVNQAVKEAENRRVDLTPSLQCVMGRLMFDCLSLTEASGLPEEVGHLVPEAEREPRHPGAEGGFLSRPPGPAEDQHLISCLSAEPGPDQENHGARGTSFMESQQGQEDR